jgi:subtilisin family serine protease
MKKFLALPVVVLMILAAIPPHSGTGTVDAAAAQTGPPSPRYLVRYADAKSNAAVVQSLANAGGQISANHPEINAVFVDSAAPGFASAIAADPNVVAVVPDMVVQWINDTPATIQQYRAPTATIQSSPLNAGLLALQWDMSITRTINAWSVTQGLSTVRVAVLDTGICAHQQDLAGKVDAAASASFINEPPACAIETVTPACPGCPAWEDRNFHGTHVASVISSNSIGTASLAPNVRLSAVKVLSCAGSGPFSAIINGIIFAANAGNDVINMSLGATFSTSLLQDPGVAALVQAVQDAVTYAEKQKGVLVVAAAGNDGLNKNNPTTKAITIPGQLDGVVAVGATTISDQRASFSNFGVSGATLMAPGGGTPIGSFPPTAPDIFVLGACSAHSVVVPACSSGHSYLFLAGTSQATPHVSGAAALVASELPASSRRSHMAVDLIRAKIVTSTDKLVTTGPKGADPVYSAGRLNTLKTVQ